MKKLFTILTILAIVIVAFLLWRVVSPYAIGFLPLARPAPPLLADEASLPFVVPEGFAVKLYVKNLPGVRVLTRDPKGVLVASLPSEGKIVALPDGNGDGKADEAKTILAELGEPHGVVFVCDNESDCSMIEAEE